MAGIFKICVCASGGGGNFQALIDSQERIGFSINFLITDRDCKAIERAARHDIPWAKLDKQALGETFFDCMEKAVPGDTNLVVLAGFMPILPASFCNKWQRKLINTHPSLLPQYGGKGMYGVRVQEAVLRNNEKYAGCTVHFVTEDVDAGDIIVQAKLEVDPSETAWELGGRVFLEENRLLPEAIKKLMMMSRAVV